MAHARLCCDRLGELRELVSRLVAWVDEADAVCNRNRCLVVHGVVRDCMWSIAAAAHAWEER
jgi:hypothetical protein